MNWIYLFTSFEGRISRKPFWIGIIVLGVLETLIALVNQQVGNERFGILCDLVLVYPEFAVAAKRGHDRNNPTWVVGILFAFSVIFDLLLLTGVLSNPNIESYSNWAVAIIIPIGLYAVILF